MLIKGTKTDVIRFPMKTYLFAIPALLLVSCETQVKQRPVPLRDAIVYAVKSIREANQDLASQKKVGLVPADATIVFSVVATDENSTTGKIGGAYGGATLGVDFSNKKTDSLTNTITIDLKSVYELGKKKLDDDATVFSQRPHGKVK